MSSDAKRYWAQRKRPIGETLHDKVFNPAPEVTQAMVLSGITWRKTTAGVWVECCSTCGSNCGQCGITGRVGNFSGPGANVMDQLVENIR